MKKLIKYFKSIYNRKEENRLRAILFGIAISMKTINANGDLNKVLEHYKNRLDKLIE